METLTANQAKIQFEDLLLKVQRAPIEISRNGNPVAVMVSADYYAAMDQLKMELLQQSIQLSMNDLAAGKVHDGEATLEAMIREERE